MKVMQKLIFSGAILIFASAIFAQLPKTDVYLAEFKNLNSQPQMVALKYLNEFNPNGYNNQPKFFSYDEIYMTAAIDTQQSTDIYHLNIKNNQRYRVTDTEKISEFSPASVPSGKSFTCVRIEPDGVDQSLWKYPADRSGSGLRLLPSLKNVGYYVWLNKDSVALFLVGSPHKLVLANVKKEKIETLSENIGRCLKTDNNGHLLFVHKLTNEDWILKSYQIQDKVMTTICRMPNGREDFEIMINGTLIVGDGPYLKTFLPGKDKDWINIADLSLKGIKNINRLSVVRDRIVFVNNK
jgi:hypothetical protein